MEVLIPIGVLFGVACIMLGMAAVCVLIIAGGCALWDWAVR